MSNDPRTCEGDVPNLCCLLDHKRLDKDHYSSRLRSWHYHHQPLPSPPTSSRSSPKSARDHLLVVDYSHPSPIQRTSARTLRRNQPNMGKTRPMGGHAPSNPFLERPALEGKAKVQKTESSTASTTTKGAKYQNRKDIKKKVLSGELPSQSTKSTRSLTELIRPISRSNQSDRSADFSG